MKYARINTPGGEFSILLPNSVIDGDGFYISYNDYDLRTYGCDTTALVVGQMEKFYILKGDHRAQYSPLIGEGLDACLAYFKKNIAEAHHYSDTISPDGGD